MTTIIVLLVLLLVAVFILGMLAYLQQNKMKNVIKEVANTKKEIEDLKQQRDLVELKERIEKDNQAWQVSFKRWTDEELQKITLRNKNFLNTLDQRTEGLVKTRERLGEAVGLFGKNVQRFMRIILHAMRGEEQELVRLMADMGRESGPEQKTEKPSAGQPPLPNKPPEEPLS